MVDRFQRAADRGWVAGNCNAADSRRGRDLDCGMADRVRRCDAPGVRVACARGGRLYMGVADRDTVSRGWGVCGLASIGRARGVDAGAKRLSAGERHL